MFVSHLVLILSLTTLPFLEAFSTTTKCNACKAVLEDVNKHLPAFTAWSEEMLHEALRDACERYVHINALEGLCVNVEENLIKRLSAWLDKIEQNLNAEHECQYLHLCPRPPQPPKPEPQPLPSELPILH